MSNELALVSRNELPGEKQSRLTVDPSVEKVPKEREERQQADLVTHQHLGADRPPEECKVRRMSRVRVYARGDKLMALLFHPLRRVVEVRSSGRHGEGSTALAKDYQEETDGDGVGVDVPLLVGWEDEV